MTGKIPSNIVFFTDKSANNFHPLTLTRPMDDMRIGIYTIRDKWMYQIKAQNFSRILPDYLEDVFHKNEIVPGKDCLWINSRFLPSEKLIQAINDLKLSERIVFKAKTVAARINFESSDQMLKINSFSADDLNPVEINEAIHLDQLWDILSLNSYEIEKDLPQTGLSSCPDENSLAGVALQKPENIYIDESAEIEPGCVIIGDEGPVIIMENAKIEAGSTLRGPVVIGNGATVKMAARIYGGSTIGPVCKVGGEVSNCIFHSYSNKAHDGFTGNSLFGQWVNLGADTNTSNLKNNYSTVRISDWDTRKEIETESQFLGTVMADHSKTAINTMLNTGTICGISSNIFMAGFSPKFIPSFSWVGSSDFGTYKFEKAIEAMKAMMSRREVELTVAYYKMMQYHFDNR